MVSVIAGRTLLESKIIHSSLTRPNIFPMLLPLNFGTEQETQLPQAPLSWGRVKQSQALTPLVPVGDTLQGRGTGWRRMISPVYQSLGTWLYNQEHISDHSLSDSIKFTYHPPTIAT